MYLALKATLASSANQVARFARDMWNSANLNDIWENEHRVWEDIV
jgi:hypothetical protein